MPPGKPPTRREQLKRLAYFLAVFAAGAVVIGTIGAFLIYSVA